MTPATRLTARVAAAAARLRRTWAEARAAGGLDMLDARTRQDLGLAPASNRPANRFYL